MLCRLEKVQIFHPAQLRHRRLFFLQVSRELVLTMPDIIQIGFRRRKERVDRPRRVAVLEQRFLPVLQGAVSNGLILRQVLIEPPQFPPVELDCPLRAVPFLIVGEETLNILFPDYDALRQASQPQQALPLDMLSGSLRGSSLP